MKFIIAVLSISDSMMMTLPNLIFTITPIITLSRTAKATLTKQAIVIKTLDNLWINTEKKISLLVSSEIQCVQRCLTTDGCFSANYNFKSE